MDSNMNDEVDRVLLRLKQLFLPASEEFNSTLPPLLLEQLGPYRILEKIGEGGMGQVYLARQLEPFEREVALKLIKSEIAGKEALARFAVEYQTLARLQHPSIAAIYDAGEWQGHPYFVMEYLPNACDLESFCRTRMPDLGELIRIFLPICDAVAYAHRRGIIHRDLKPANMMVLNSGTEPQVKIIDFGIAKALYHPLAFEQSHVTIGGVGTPAFMAPEQLANQAQDVRTDVYALGASLNWAVLQNPKTLLGWEKVTSLRSKEIKALIAKAMATDPEQRYSSANELHEDMQRFLHGDALIALAKHSGYAWRKRITKHWRPLVLGVLALLFAALSALNLFQVRNQLHQELASTKAALTRAEEAERNRDQATRLILDFLQSMNPQTPPNRRERLKTLDAMRDHVRLSVAHDTDLYFDCLAALAENYAGMSQYQSAIELFKEILEGLPLMSPVSERELSTQERLALVHYRAGHFAMAVEHFEALRRQLKLRQVQDRLLVNRTEREYAESLLAIGKPQQALDIIRDIIPHDLANPLENGEQGVALMAEGNILRALNRRDDAERSYRAAYIGLRNLYQENAPNTLNAMESLAVLMMDRGRASEAVTLLERALKHRIQGEGASAQASLHTQMNLGTALYRLGRAQMAYTQLSSAYVGTSELLGATHPDTMTCLHNLIVAETALDRLSEAIPHARTLLESRTQTLGARHRQTLESANSLGALLTDAQDYAKAQELLENGLADAELEFGPRDPITLLLRCSLAENYLERQLFPDAARHLKQLVALAPAVFEPAHPYHALFAGLYGMALAGEGRTEQARPNLERGTQDLPEYLSDYRKKFAATLAKLPTPPEP